MSAPDPDSDPGPRAAPALRFDDVRARLGGRDVLCGVTLALPRGQVLAVAGRNGAGKTTLFRVASRVVPLAGGRIEIEGRPLGSFSRRALARAIAVVPQDASVAFPFRAEEVVLMGRFPHLGTLGFESRRDLALARDAMERVGVADLADRLVSELSGGERQLVLVARALAQAPRVLLLDEPTAHLDLRHRLDVLALVRDFARAGGSAVVVSHDLTLAARSADCLALLAEGRVLAAGRPADVLTPERLRAAFALEADVEYTRDGYPVIVPR